MNRSNKIETTTKTTTVVVTQSEPVTVCRIQFEVAMCCFIEISRMSIKRKSRAPEKTFPLKDYFNSEYYKDITFEENEDGTVNISIPYTALTKYRNLGSIGIENFPPFILGMTSGVGKVIFTGKMPHQIAGAARARARGYKPLHNY